MSAPSRRVNSVTPHSAERGRCDSSGLTRREHRREEPAVSTVEAAPADQAAARIGAGVRRLRHARGLTLVQLAEAAGLSHPFLSQLERGLARPSIGSLERIARALGSSQLELLAGAEEEAQPAVGRPSASVVRRDDGTRGPYSDGEARMLAQGRRRFHPMEISGTNRTWGDAFVHAEDEFVYVVDGAIEIDLGPEGRHLLAQGDSVYCDGGVPHRWRALDGRGYRLLVVKETPTPRGAR